MQAGSKFQVVTSNPTAVTVSSFGAGATASGARVTWRTAAETGLVGFNVWRRAGSKGRYVKLNAWLIAATGGIAGGHRYSFRDARVRPGRTYYYRLETVATGGARRWVGPAKVTILR